MGLALLTPFVGIYFLTEWKHSEVGSCHPLCHRGAHVKYGTEKVPIGLWTFKASCYMNPNTLTKAVMSLLPWAHSLSVQKLDIEPCLEGLKELRLLSGHVTL